MTSGKSLVEVAVLLSAFGLSGIAFAQDTLSPDEVKTAAAAKFDKLDKNGDAHLDADEARELLGDKAFKLADSDDDGSIDKKEFLALAEKLFKRADVDRDGSVDTKELNGPNGKMLKRLLR
jgi:Ca2+-binding EF-hand superfamily protein